MKKDLQKIAQVVKLREEKKLSFRDISKILFHHLKNPANHVKTVWRWYQYHKVGSYPQVDEKTAKTSEDKSLDSV